MSQRKAWADPSGGQITVWRKDDEPEKYGFQPGQKFDPRGYDGTIVGYGPHGSYKIIQPEQLNQPDSAVRRL